MRKLYYNIKIVTLKTGASYIAKGKDRITELMKREECEEMFQRMCKIVMYR